MADYKNFTVEIDADGIALVTWDMPDRSMNVFTEEVMEELEAIIDAVSVDESVKGAVITSGKESFSGGADLSMLQARMGRFEAAKAEDSQKGVEQLFENCGRMSMLWRKLETSGKPWVSAINGSCMGGAFEMSLACHGRVAADAHKVKMALPEVKIGIFPGAGGTQRVPRLANTQDALQMLTTGQSLSPEKAKAMGLIHEVAPRDELISTAKRMIKEGLKPVQPWDEKGFKLPGGPVYSPAGANVWPPAIAILRRETYGNYPAATAILKCVYEGLLVPFDTGLTIERRYFTEILQTREAAAMIRSLFVSQQELSKGARRPENVPARKFEKVGVLGAGFMGGGIAYVTAAAGIPVVLLDRDQEAAEKGKAHSERLLDRLVEKGRATEADKERILSRITATAEYGEIEDADLIIEAVFEDSDVKKEVIEKVEAVLKPSAIFASNTSTIPISNLAEYSKRPEQFIGLHFFSPVDKMMLVEIILGQKTSDEALVAAMDYARAIRKTPIIVNDTRGFFANRCVLRYMQEAYSMLIEGVPAPMVENAAKMAGMPVGPLALTDETAVDLAQKIMKQTVRDLGEKAVDPRQIELIDTMVDKYGRFGRKNGKGFYDYPEKPGKKRLWPELKELYPQRDPDEIDVQELKERLLYAMALEAARLIQQGVVSDPREADVGSILSFGFAPFTGGVLSYIDGIGAARFVKRAEHLQKQYGKQFKPPKILMEMAENGRTFYEQFPPKDSGEARTAA